jgi:hypothetical protein
MSARHYYPRGQHPSWCDLGQQCSTDKEPTHVGRKSQMFVQSAEARLTIELARMDDTAPIGNIAGSVQVRVTLDQGATVGGVEVELSVDEVRAATLLLAQYVEYAESEGRGSVHQPLEVIVAEGSM